MPWIVPARSGSSVGAHLEATPVVGCAQATTLRFVLLGSAGKMIAPVTATGSPVLPVER